jgi:preprotein translocase subunit SecG
MAELIVTPLTVVHVLACAFLILVVLLQPGKSGGLGLFATPAATQVFGGRGAGTILTKITWGTAAVFFLSSIGLAYLSTSSDESLQARAEAAEAATLDKVEEKAESKPEPEPPAEPAPEKPAPAQPAPPPAEPEQSEPEQSEPVQPAPKKPARKQATSKQPAPKQPAPASKPAPPAPASEPGPSEPAQPAPDQPGAPATSE